MRCERRVRWGATDATPASQRDERGRGDEWAMATVAFIGELGGLDGFLAGATG
jgi:hypothetical protein